MVASTASAKPIREIGSFFAMSLDALVAAFTTRLNVREFIVQAWFTARVSLAPAVMLVIPFNVLAVFFLNILFVEIGAQDISGAGAALVVVTQLGPFSTALVVGGAAATAMCADLGARTIREEIDAMRVLGIDPIHRLVVPRIAAIILNAVLLVAVVNTMALTMSYLFNVYVANVTPGSFATSLTLLAGLPEVVVSLVEAFFYGVAAGTVACYKGLTVGGGPQGVGNAVNETVVYTFVILIFIHTVLQAVVAPVLTQ